MRATPRRTRLLVAALLIPLAACRESTGPDNQLAAARARWAEHGPTTYTITVARACECLPEMSGPVIVTVRARAVTSREYAGTGAPVASPLAEQFPSVEQLFARIEAAQRAHVAQLVVIYHPALGYPVRVAIDYLAGMVDDEVTYSATDLRAFL